MRPDEARIRTFGLTISATTLVPPQPAGFDSFVTVNAGVATLRRDASQISIDRTAGVFVASGEPYALAFVHRCELRIVYACESLALAKPGVLRVDPLLRALIERATACGYLDPAGERDARLLDVIEDELVALEMADRRAALIMPRDTRLRSAAALFLEADERVSIASAAAHAGMTTRTFDRIFRLETGLAPQAWRKRAMLERAHAALVCGATVTEAGLACGYASTSAFIHAFRSAFGSTPGDVGKRATLGA